MNFKSVSRKAGMYFFYTLSAVSSLIFAFGFILFIFNIDNKEILKNLLISLTATAAFWLITFGLSVLGEQDKTVRKKEFIKLLHKFPLILLSTFITGIYILIIYFFFLSITVTENGAGTEFSDTVLMTIMVVVGIVIILLVMNKVMKTEKQDIPLTIYSQLSVLKWTSLVVLPFCIWSVFYFYHKGDAIDWVAMGIWFLILYGFYRLFNRIAEKVQNHIVDTNLNRIIHEKKKRILNEQSASKTEEKIDKASISDANSIADELQKLKNLLDANALTEEEYNTQKERLLKS